MHMTASPPHRRVLKVVLEEAGEHRGLRRVHLLALAPELGGRLRGRAGEHGPSLRGGGGAAVLAADGERLEDSDQASGAREDTNALPGLDVEEAEGVGGHAAEGGLSGGGDGALGEVMPELAGREVHGQSSLLGLAASANTRRRAASTTSPDTDPASASVSGSARPAASSSVSMEAPALPASCGRAALVAWAASTARRGIVPPDGGSERVTNVHTASVTSWGRSRLIAAWTL